MNIQDLTGKSSAYLVKSLWIFEKTNSSRGKRIFKSIGSASWQNVPATRCEKYKLPEQRLAHTGQNFLVLVQSPDLI